MGVEPESLLQLIISFYYPAHTMDVIRNLKTIFEIKYHLDREVAWQNNAKHLNHH